MATNTDSLQLIQKQNRVCTFHHLNYSVGQIKWGQCSFFCRSKARFKLKNFDNFWQVK